MGLARPSRRCVASHVPRSVCGSLTTCQWTTLRHTVLQIAFGISFLPMPTIRTQHGTLCAPLPCGFSPWSCSQGASRMVGLGDVSRHFCRTVPKPFPSCVGSLWHGFHDAVRVSPSGPHRFSVALLVTLPLA